jgi:hypothetical protein
MLILFAPLIDLMHRGRRKRSGLAEALRRFDARRPRHRDLKRAQGR